MYVHILQTTLLAEPGILHSPNSHKLFAEYQVQLSIVVVFNEWATQKERSIPNGWLTLPGWPSR